MKLILNFVITTKWNKFHYFWLRGNCRLLYCYLGFFYFEIGINWS